MTQYLKPFEPVAGGTIALANPVSASSKASLPESANVVALYNTSATATSYWRCQPDLDGSAAVAAIAPSVGTNGDAPVPPGAQIRLSVPAGKKAFSIIASAADGNLLITPGIGN